MYCFAEGVNFDHTVYDTQDIATIRGSSMLLEELHTQLNDHLSEFSPQRLNYGAAQVSLRLGLGSADDIRVAIADFLRTSPWCHMSIVYGVDKNPVLAKRAARIMQYQTWTVPDPGAPGAPGSKPDALDLTRPSQTEIPGPADVGTRWVSHSVAARRGNGVGRRRPTFLNHKDFQPPRDFDQMLSGAGVNDMISNKLALIVADGIGGGDLRRAFEDEAAFSMAMEDMRTKLGLALNAWAVSKGVHVIDGQRLVPRFDALVWGGDDMVFVMPAWLALPFLKVFFRTTEQYSFKAPNGETLRLHHRAACIIANKKTPIRQMRAVAKDAEERLGLALKDARNRDQPAGGAFTVDIFESAALPHGNVLSYRSEQYGVNYRNGVDIFHSSDVNRIVEFCKGVSASDSEGLTLTLLHGALQDLRGAGHTVLSRFEVDPVTNQSSCPAWRRVYDNLHRVQNIEGAEEQVARLIGAFSCLDRPFALMLAQVAQLLPYVQFEVGSEA